MRRPGKHEEVRGYCREIMNAVDPSLAETDPLFMAATVLLASMRVGASEAAVTAILRYDDDYVAQVGARLRASGIWKDRELSKEHVTRWFSDDDRGGIAFLMDLNVAAGTFRITGPGKNGPLYAVTEEGERHVERMIRGRKRP